MNEQKQEKRDLVAEAEMQPIPETDEKKYTLRGALQALEHRQAAVAKRKEKILKLQAENKEDQRMIRKLQTICDELRQGEIMRRIGQICGSGNEITTERINKLLDFCELAGDALSEVSAEQLVGMLQGSPAQAQELAEEARAKYEKNTSELVSDNSDCNGYEQTG